MKKINLVAVDLDDDPKLEEVCLSTFYVTMHGFSGSVATKIVENHLRRAYIKFLPPPGATPATQSP